MSGIVRGVSLVPNPIANPMPTPTDQTREHFPYQLEIATRWSDFDMLMHMNNVQYYRFFECIILHYLASIGADLLSDPIIPFAVETSCNFKRPILPHTTAIEAELRVARIGNSSVQYEINLFEKQHATPSASGKFVHVYIDRSTQKPTAIPEWIRQKLEKLVMAKER